MNISYTCSLPRLKCLQCGVSTLARRHLASALSRSGHESLRANVQQLKLPSRANPDLSTSSPARHCGSCARYAGSQSPCARHAGPRAAAAAPTILRLSETYARITIFPRHSANGCAMATKKSVTLELSRRALLLQHDYQIFLDGRAPTPELAHSFAEKARGHVSAGKLTTREIILELGEQPPAGLDGS